MKITRQRQEEGNPEMVSNTVFMNAAPEVFSGSCDQFSFPKGMRIGLAPGIAVQQKPGCGKCAQQLSI